jgi:hypothetical protein
MTTYRVNSYFAVLLITIFGGAATILITHIANQDTYSIYANDQQAALGL